MYEVIIFTALTSMPHWHVKPLGAYQVATELRAHGFTVKVIDWADRIFADKQLFYGLMDDLISDKTLFLGFSTTFFKTENEAVIDSLYPHTMEDFDQTLLPLKQKHPNLKIVLGGANSAPRNYKKFSSLIDYSVQGFGDIQAVDLAKHLKFGTPLKFNIERIKNRNVRILNYDEKGQNFNFKYSMTKFDHEDIIQPSDILPLETSRGCMFKCSFCSFPLLGRNKNDDSYYKDYQYLKDELEYNYKEFGVTKYFIVDDTFNERTAKLKRLVEIQDELGFQIEYSAYIRLDLISAFPEQMQYLKDSGMRSAFLGIESMHDQAAKTVRKGLGERRIKETLEKIRALYGQELYLYGSFIIGLPYETEKDVYKTLEWILRDDCPLNSASFNSLAIYDSTFVSDFYLQHREYGYVLDENTHMWTSPWMTKERSMELTKEFNTKIAENKIPFGNWAVLALRQYGFTWKEILENGRNFNYFKPLENMNARYQYYVDQTLKLIKNKKCFMIL